MKRWIFLLRLREKSLKSICRRNSRKERTATGESEQPAVAGAVATTGSSLKLAEDRVFRQNAICSNGMLSGKEAYEQVKTELATLNADIDLVKANIAMTELRAPFDRSNRTPGRVSVGSYASPTTIVAKLTKIIPLKIEFSVPERYAKPGKKGHQPQLRTGR